MNKKSALRNDVNNYLKCQKLNRGISLISLVITIIVLLILSGISISMLSGNNSIINQTIGARNTTNEEQDKEKIEMEVLNCQGKNGSYEIEDLKTNLSNVGATVTGTKIPLSVEYNEKNTILMRMEQL